VNREDFLLPVPSNPPDAGSIIAVQFGADWIPVLLSALELLRFEELWLSPPTDLIPQIDELMGRIANKMIISPQLYPNFITHFHKFSTKLSGNAITLFNSNVFDFATTWWQTPSAQFDTFSFPVFLGAGAYTLSYLGQKSVASPKLDISTDESEVLQLDLYNATTLQNQTVSGTIAIHADGNHLITVQVIAKNALSTGWNVPALGFSFKKL